jgi:hypothetical protein
LVCGACLDVLEYRADDGQIHSVTAAAVSATAAEMVSAWIEHIDGLAFGRRRSA